MKGIKINEGERRIEDHFGWSTADSLNIALFSDIHIPDSDKSGEDRQIRSNFLSLLDHAMAKDPCLTIISGDLGQHEGGMEAYRWIRTVLEKTFKPYLIIPGNHDQNVLIETIFPEFPLQEEKLFYWTKFGDWSFIFLDSSPDSVSPGQIRWMKQLLNQAKPGSLWALILHHPPIQCGCSYMDAHYPLKNNAPLLRVLDKTDKIKHIFCGHYHTSKTVDYNSGIQLHLTPSTWFQIDETEPEFSIKDQRIGYRSISIKGATLRTSVTMMLPP